MQPLLAAGTVPHMAQPRRVEYPGARYHIVARAVFGRSLFADDADRRRFLRRFGRIVERYGWHCLAYCLMGTHYHLVLATPRPNLAFGMQELHSAYARGFNLRHGRHGHVFSERYHPILLEREEHALAAVRYAVRNPVAAGLCSSPAEWRWSSHRATAGTGARPSFLATDEALALFASDPRTARRRYSEFAEGINQTAPSGGSVTSAEYSCSCHDSFSASIPSPLPTSEPP